ncbi:hypothetical protein Moror_13250 [Moniliophthora roreri MCA 2997]|uniref:Secreted protein n=1 Tax=Moniliophthora roreri (strain MCA 2997) TaxID=1381753 RepID=V2WPW6_MONRO|nr:hypothetical protein Moror_13250 [Moniliophthora roreri MCA 2997]
MPSLIAIVGFALVAGRVVATPFPVALPLPIIYADPVHSNSLREDVAFLGGRAVWNANESTPIAPTSLPFDARDLLLDDHLLGISGLLNLFSTSSADIDSMYGCAQKCGSADDFRNRCSSYSSSILIPLQTVSDMLRKPAERGGLRYFDNHDQLQILLKRTIDFIKNLLLYIKKLVDHIPILQPLMSALTEQIKCIIEEILDILENITDALLNDCKVKLGLLLQACSCQDEILGLCLDDGILRGALL